MEQKKQQNKPTYMQNRELSWLKFNDRVLNEANRIETPQLERLKFISIFTSNLDEFFMIRVGTLTDSMLYGKGYIDNKTDMSEQEQLTAIYQAVIPLYKSRENAYNAVMSGLARQGVQLVHIADLQNNDIKTLRRYFVQNVLPLLSPQIIDSRHPFPHIANKQIHIAVTLEYKKKTLFGLIAVPHSLDRLVFLGDDYRFVLLEDLIWYFAELAFGNYKVIGKNIIAVTRNADIDTEERLDEDMDFRLHMQNLLKRRQRLSPVRLELVYPASPELLMYLCDKLTLSFSQVYYSVIPLDQTFCYTLERILDRSTVTPLVWPTHTPAETIVPFRRGGMIRMTQNKDLLLHYPYESILPFLALIRQAADDDSVLSIKITFYRIDIQSKLAETLILAAENGKEVVVLVELRARFDEVNNIEWAQRLEDAGCRVIYGLVGYKVHSKVCLITRKEGGRIQYITQVGTGNYNEKTARLYTDLSLITAHQGIGQDAHNFFNNLMLGNLEGEYEHLWVAPNSFKNQVLKHIEDERQKALKGDVGFIVIKCNSLTDKEVIEKLSEASCDGVQIHMIIRGICCIIPQVQKATENIHIISIVGKFLEHSRIFCFGTEDNTKIFISSADLMTRNTQRRVEVACPIYDIDLRNRILDMFEHMLGDNTQAWEQLSDGGYISRYQSGTDLILNSQEYFTKQARLSASTAQADNPRRKVSLITRIIRTINRVFEKRS